MCIETYPNTSESNKIGLDMIYQANITEYINRMKECKKNLRKSFTFILYFCNKQLPNSIGTNVEYEKKIQDNLIDLLEFIKILMHEP